MERYGPISSFLAAALVGLALVVLWPDNPHLLTAPIPTEPVSKDATTTPPVPPQRPAPPAPPPVASPTALRDHLRDAPERWLELAATLEDTDDPAIRALAPACRDLANRTPRVEPHPPLQAVTSLLLEERATIDRLRSLGFDTGSLGEEVDATVAHTVGRHP